MENTGRGAKARQLSLLPEEGLKLDIGQCGNDCSVAGLAEIKGGEGRTGFSQGTRSSNQVSTQWQRRFLDLAKHVSSYSKDPSTQVGAVVTDGSNRIVSIGYNGLPQGVDDTEERLNDRDLKYNLMVHGEVNAILFAGRDVGGCTLYTYPFMPCSRCAGIVIQVGIKQVVTLSNDNPRWQDSFRLTETMFKEAGVELTYVNNFSN